MHFSAHPDFASRRTAVSTLVTAFVSDACWPHQSKVLIGGTACSQHGLFCCSGKAPGGSWQLDRLCQQQEERCQEVPHSLNWQQSLWVFSTDFISHRSGCIAMFKRKAEEEPAGKSAKFGSGTDSDRKATFARNLAALNSQFATWVAEQATSAPKELWTDGVEDYLKHAQQLLTDFKDVLDGTAAGGKPNEPPAAAAPSSGSGKPPLAPGGLFGAAGGAAGGAGGSAAPPASIFGALPPAGGGTSGGFAFGSASVPAFGAASAPAFGGFGAAGSTPGSAANSGGSGLFKVPSTGTLGSSFNTGAATGADDEEGEEEQQDAEPSVQVEAGEGTELLAKHRVKLTSMPIGTKKWADKGKGTLTLRRSTAGEGAGQRPYFVFTTDSGRVLINAPLVKNLKPTTNTKAPAAVIMILISSVDGKQEEAMHMFRCESVDAAKQLIATISEHA
ncbi:hypothetical protein ABPG77_005181 [Micractinium sp. CCAP 211/92]